MKICLAVVVIVAVKSLSKNNEKAMACMGWFLDDCIIDYETIKKYFGKYKLIREFCDERLEQQKNKEKNLL